MDSLDQYWVTLHGRDCTCNQCQSWFGDTTAAAIAYNTLMIPRQNWVELGCPRDIEAYYEAINKQQDICPCCGQRKQFNFSI